MRYLQLIVVALFMSCAKKSPYETAKKLFEGEKNCMQILQNEMMKSECPQLHFKHLGPHDIMIRCKKLEAERGKFWDNYIFRISSINLVYTQTDQTIIDEHTICIDQETRIEAYPPEGIQ